MLNMRIKYNCVALALSSLSLAACSGGGSSGTTASTQAAPTEAAEITWVKQNAQSFSSSDPSDTDYSDLQAFGNAVGNARIVALAEPDHGSGTVFDMKTRLVKYLHEQKGFDVLMMESSMFSVNRVWQQALSGQNVDDVAVGPPVGGVSQPSIFFMYSMSAQGRKVLQYIDAQRATAHPLILSTYGLSGVGAYNEINDLLPMLETFLNSRGSPIPASSGWSTYKDVTQNSIITAQNPSPAQADIDAFHSVSDQLVSELCPAQADTHVFPDSPGLWCLIATGLRSNGDSRFGLSNTAEAVTAANFKWLDDHVFSGHKIILWGHYQHLGKGTQLPQGGGTANMGNILHQTYGNQMYVVAFTASSGSELAWWNGPSTTLTSPVDSDTPLSMEDILHQLSQPKLFVDARLNPPPAAIAYHGAKTDNFLYSYLGVTVNTELGNAYDGLFYFDTVAPATMNR